MREVTQMKKISYEVTLEGPNRPLDESALEMITDQIAEALAEAQVIDPFVWFHIDGSRVGIEFLSDDPLEQIHAIVRSALRAAKVCTSGWAGSSQELEHVAWIASDRLIRGPESKLSA